MSAGTLPTLILFILLISYCGCERPTDYNQTDNGVPPAVPTGLIVYYANNALVFIIWHSNVEPDLKGYNVYRSTKATFTADTAAYYTISIPPAASGTSFNTTYFWRVLTYSNNRSSPNSVSNLYKFILKAVD